MLFQIPNFKLLLNGHFGVRFLVDPTQILFLMNMVGTSVLWKLRMRKQNTKTTGIEGEISRPLDHM